MGYRFINDMTLADAAFEASGSSPEELFRMAGDALLGIMIENPAIIEHKVERAVRITLSGMTMKAEAYQEIMVFEDLLHQFLEKILYFKDAEGLLLRAGQIQFDASSGCLDATLAGETISDLKQKHDALGTDAKAITHHRFAVKRTDEGWKATVVVDV